MEPTLPKPWMMTRQPSMGMPRCFDRLVADDGDAAAGGLLAAAGAAEIDWFAGDDGVDGLAHVHRVGVHDPGHGLLVGAYVGGGNIFFRADEFDEFGGVAAGHALEFALGHLLGSQMMPPLAPPKGMLTTAHFQVIQEARARTSSRETSGRVADAAFGGAAGDGVLDAVAGEDFDGAVVHGDGDVDDDFAGGIAEDLPDALIEVEFFCGKVESSGLGFPGVCLLLEGESLHFMFPFFCCWYPAILRPSFASHWKRIRLGQPVCGQTPGV